MRDTATMLRGGSQARHVRLPSYACLCLLVALAALGVASPAGATTHAKPKCVVPKLTGDTLATARRRLTAAHCTLGTVTEPEAKKGHALIVSATTPKAGKREKNDARVSVTLKVKQSPAATTPTVTTPTTTIPTTTTTTPTTTTPSLQTTSTVLATSIGTVAYGTDYFFVGIDAGTTANGVAISSSAPETLTVTDVTTGQVVGTFQQPSEDACALIETALGNGEFSLASYNCQQSFAFTVNGADSLQLGAMFPGDSTYAASTSEPAII